MAERSDGSKPVSILHLEDNPAEAEFFSHVIRSGGVDCRITVASDREAFLRELSNPAHELILSDNAIPRFSGTEALELASARRPDIPFIFLSGSIGEDAAIEALRNGATDYILKDRATRLSSAILRAMKEKEERDDRKRAEEALRLSEERYALAAKGANDGLWDWDLRAGTLYYSPRWKSMLGHAEEEIGGAPEEWLGRIHPEEADIVRLQIERHVKGATPKLECEYRMRTRDGEYLWVQCRGIAIRDAGGEAYRMAGSQGDISERKRAEAQLLYDAFHDSLTGLVNRNLFQNSLQRLLWMGRRRTVEPFCVLLLGLDRFAAVNDGLGRPAGDRILKEAAGRIAERIRPGDTLARLGGDEFAVLMENMGSHGEIVRTVQGIQAAFREAFRIEGREAYLSLCAGIVQGPRAYASPEEAIRDAGIALGRAKAQGKSSFCVFDPGMHARAVSLLNLETDLRHAIERDEFRIHYQPVIDLARGRISGFEALVRWQHPERGLVPPMEFIPLAEESHFINDIGRIVLEKACARMRAWQDAHPRGRGLTVSVNVSGKQFRQPDLIDQIRRTVADAGLDPACLKLEVTETAIMDDPEAAAEMLSELRASGIGLQIDDFGTGYSSLGYLHKFPMQALKIDRSFVSLIGPEGENSEIASAIVSMAHNLGMQVIAEGIETGAHLRWLEAMKCDFGQGFYFHRPLEESQAERLIAS